MLNASLSRCKIAGKLAAAADAPSVDRALVSRAGQSFATPRARQEASAEIQRLRSQPAQLRSEQRREDKAVRGEVAARPADATAFRDGEITGYGSRAEYSRDAGEQAGPRAVHCKREAYDVYVGRGHGSKWGNPYREGKDGTREQVIDKYRAWLMRQPALLGQLDELRGKRLGCWCAPHRCHADVLAELANAPRERQQQWVREAQALRERQAIERQQHRQVSERTQTRTPERSASAARAPQRQVQAEQAQQPQVLATYSVDGSQRELVARERMGALSISDQAVGAAGPHYPVAARLSSAAARELSQLYVAEAAQTQEIPMQHRLGPEYAVGPEEATLSTAERMQLKQARLEAERALARQIAQEASCRSRARARQIDTAREAVLER